jgi:hypothetical protein
VKQGPLQHSDAGPPGGEGPPQRVAAVLGPGATFAGIAGTLAPCYATAASSGGPAAPTLGELARAIAVYAKDYLAAGNGWQFHTVGVILPLPVEIDPASGEWTVDADRVRALAASFNAAWRPRLRTPPAAVGIPDALDLEAAGAALAGELPVADLAAQLWAQSLRNPFDAVLLFLAALRALDSSGAVTAALAALSSATPAQLSVLAATRAGNGILRRLASLLAAPPAGTDPAQAANARALLDNALHQGPAGSRTLVPHRDVPQTPAQQAVRRGTARAADGAAADPPGGLHQVVLGRDVAAGRPASARADGTSYTGPAFAGRVDLRSYLTADMDHLSAATDPALLTLLANSSGAGEADHVQRLDSVTARDANLVTAGLDQWGATTDAGLPALLATYKAAAPDEFDLFFALHGLDVQPGPAGGPAHQLLLIGPDGTGTAPDAGALRAFFGGTADANGAVTFSSEWAARFRLPVLVSAAHRRVQVAQAAPRAAAKSNDFEKKAAQFGPFPAAYKSPFGTSTSLAEKLNKRMTGGATFDRAHATAGSVIGHAKAGAAISADTLVAAVADLTGAPASPAYGGCDDDQTLYVGSLAKIAPMYAAFELRFRIRQLIAAVRAAGLHTTHKDWLALTRKAIDSVWGPQICRGFPGMDSFHLNTRFKDTFPSLDTIFTFGADGSVDFAKGNFPTQAARDAAIKTAGGFGAVPGQMGFSEWMELMILWSNGHAAAKVIDSINYPYLNHVLREAGFFRPATMTGIWVSQDYDQGIWLKNTDLMQLSPLGARHYNKEKTNFMATARDVATLLTLIAMGKLFPTDTTHSCDEMLALMRKTFTGDTAPANPAGSGNPSPFAAAVGFTAGDTISSKIGLGDPIPEIKFMGLHECAVITHTTPAGRSVRYVAVVLGGYENSSQDRPYWDNTAVAVDGSIQDIHP